MISSLPPRPEHPRRSPGRAAVRCPALLALVLASTALAAAEGRIYKCDTPDGRIEYSDKPCGEEVVIEDTTDFGGAVAVDAPPASADGEADASQAATGAMAAPAPSNRERISSDYDRRMDEIDERIAALNERIAEAQTDRRSPEFLADLADQKRELRERRNALAADKVSALEALGPADDPS